MPTLFTHPKIVFLDQEREDLNTLKNNAPTLLTMTAHHITLSSFTLAPQICSGGSVLLLQWTDFPQQAGNK